MRIKELEPEERPVEKMLDKGVAALSNVELLAVLLRSGTGKANVIDVARNLLRSGEGRLGGLSSMSIERMTETGGVGKMKAATIAAAFEIGRRFACESFPAEKVSVTDPKMIYKVMAPLLKGIDHEECWVIYLNRANYILCKEKLTVGSLSETVLDTRKIIVKTLEKKAAGIILVHNHPSGNPRPGKNDLLQTEKLKKAAAAMNISFLDHIIISDDCFFSFSDEKMIFASG